jgi:hypothetical protein
MPNDDLRTNPDITVTDELDSTDAAVISDGLRAYDLIQTGYYDFRPFAVFVRDPQAGKVVGGLYGRSEFGLVYVDWLFSARGLAPCTDRQSGAGDGGGRGAAPRLHAHRVDDALRRSTRLLQETGLRCCGADRLRLAGPHALLHDEEALTPLRRLARISAPKRACPSRNWEGVWPEVEAGPAFRSR